MGISKNQLAGVRGLTNRNEEMNGGIHDCLRKYNSANVGAMWKTRKKNGKEALIWKIKRKGLGYI